jgi:hypothetical protein
MNETSNEQVLPELDSLKSDVEYLRHLRKRLWDHEHRVSQAVQAIPALEREIQEIEDSRKVSSAALATLLSALERVSALATIGPENHFVQSHIPAHTTRSSTSYTLAEFIVYFSTIPEKRDVLRKSLESARGVLHSRDADQKRLRKFINNTGEAINDKYELVHPIHRLPRTLLTRIFGLVGSEEYQSIKFKIMHGRHVSPHLSPTRLSLVCSRWRDIADATDPLWNQIFVTGQSPPTPFRTPRAKKPASVLAVDGNDSPQGNEGSLLTRHIESVAARMSIRELIYSGSAVESVLGCIVILPHLRRLSLTYIKFRSDSIIITLPGTLDNLTYLSCVGAYPSFTSTLSTLL